MSGQPDPKGAPRTATKRALSRRSRIGETKIRQLGRDEPRPEGEPRRYSDPRGYVRLRWKVGRGEYVEVYEHRLDAGLPDVPVSIHPRPPLDPDRFGGYRSRSAQQKAERAEQRRAERAALVADIVRLYREGKTTIEVGRIIGRDPSAITRALKTAGFEARKPWDYAVPLDEAEAVRLYVEDEVPPDEIAHRLGVGAVRIRRVLTARGVTRRPGRPRSRRRSYASDFAEARPHVIARARGLCEVRMDGCDGHAVHVHHRKMRSQGGKNGLENLIAACGPCHREIHRSPARSYACGWLVRSYEESELVPVQRGSALSFLASDGSVHNADLPAMMPR